MGEGEGREEGVFPPPHRMSGVGVWVGVGSRGVGERSGEGEKEAETLSKDGVGAGLPVAPNWVVGEGWGRGVVPLVEVGETEVERMGVLVPPPPPRVEREGSREGMLNLDAAPETVPPLTPPPPLLLLCVGARVTKGSCEVPSVEVGLRERVGGAVSAPS